LDSENTAPQAPRRDGVRLSLLFNFIGQVSTVLSGALISILLARHYGATILGQWSVGLVYANLVGTVVEGGLGRVLMRDAARDPAIAGRALGQVVKGRLWLGAIAVPAALAASGVMATSWSAWSLVPLLVVARWIEGIQSSYQSALFTLGDFRIPNLLETGRRLVRLAAIGCIVAAGANIQWAAVAMLVTAILSNRVLVRATKKVLTIDYSGATRAAWIDAAWFWANGVLFWITSEIGLLMTAQLSGEHATGIYAAALRLTLLFLIIPRTINNFLIPRLFRSAKSGDGLHRQLSGTAIMLSALGTLIMVETWFGAEPIIELVYGEQYREAIPVFAVTAGFLALNFARIPATWYLTTSDRVRMVTIALGLAAVSNVIANLVLIPRLGSLGAAWAAVISEGLLGVWAMAVAVRFTGPRILVATALGACVGGLAFGAHVLIGPHLPWLASAILVTASSLSLLYWLGRRLLAGWNPLGIMGAPKGSLADAGTP
jgi:O-antigen/teichoic acid export membrane protein